MNNKFGFTLLEAILVIAIICILVLFVTPSVKCAIKAVDHMQREANEYNCNNEKRQEKAEYGW